MQPPATSDELRYLRYVVLNISSLDHTAEAVKSFEDLFAKQHGLTLQESASIHSLAQTLKPILTRHGQTVASIAAVKRPLSPADLAILTALDTERDQAIATLANQLLNAVRPEIATRLRATGRTVAAQAKQAP